MDRRKLPIGIQTFRRVREDGCYYVDETRYVGCLVAGGTHYFLSRPRRFGKSLFLDTLKELLEGSEELFEGLAIHQRWDWSVRHPVVRVSFGSGHFAGDGDLRAEVEDRLRELEDAAGIADPPEAPAGRLRHLIRTLHERTGRRVVVLIDEYDKPILDALDTPEVAPANRDYLRGLYAVVKDCDAHIRFSFITGVSKFSGAFSGGARGACPSHVEVSLFSGLNNLLDITLDSRYSAICGYTEADLDTVFAPELPGLDRVANPRVVRRLLVARRRYGLQPVRHPAAVPDRLPDHSGSGAARRAHELSPRLPKPGGAPRLKRVAAAPLGAQRRGAYAQHRPPLRPAEGERLRGPRSAVPVVLREHPYEWYTNNDIANFEGYYASVFYLHFAALGLDVAVEESTSHDRLDMAVRFEGRVYVFEFKVVEQAGEGGAMAQLKDRGYADKYRAPDVDVHLIGVEFSSASRNVVTFEHGAA